jgi:hypothetical protein
VSGEREELANLSRDANTLLLIVRKGALWGGATVAEICRPCLWNKCRWSSAAIVGTLEASADGVAEDPRLPEEM